MAACIGREFAYPLLAAVSPLPEAELRAALDRLAAAELVFARGEPPEAGYSFKHALVRDAAYESLLKTRRQQLHARIARVLEERFPETADAEPELLARHCTEAGLAEQAVDYWQRAGQQALARSATAEAVEHLTRGLEVLAGLSGGAERQRARARPAARAGPGIDRREGLRGAGDGARLRPGSRAVPRAGRRPGALPGPVRALHRPLPARRAGRGARGRAGAAAARPRTGRRRRAGDRAPHRRLRLVPPRPVGREPRRTWRRALALYDPGRDRGSAFVYALDTSVVCLVLARPRARRAGLSRRRPWRGRGRRSPTPASSPTRTRWRTP